MFFRQNLDNQPTGVVWLLVGSNKSHCQIFEFVLALASDQRSSVEGKMLTDKGA